MKHLIAILLTLTALSTVCTSCVEDPPIPIGPNTPLPTGDNTSGGEEIPSDANIPDFNVQYSADAIVIIISEYVGEADIDIRNKETEETVYQRHVRIEHDTSIIISIGHLPAADYLLRIRLASGATHTEAFSL